MMQRTPTAERWQIVCGRFAGTERSAVELLNAGVARETDYLPVTVAADDAMLTDCHHILIGTRRSNPCIGEAVRADEIPHGGYLVRVCDSPLAEGKQAVILAGDDRTPGAVIWAAAHFLGTYLPLARQRKNHMPYFRRLFAGPMMTYDAAEAPAFGERGIWTWGHCIYDYRRFAQNMARLGLNAITIWNDHAPLNLAEVVDCFHQWGIKVIFGYSWGWDDNGRPDIGSPEALTAWRRRAVEVYAREYAEAGGDGIYFQSFTETSAESIGGVPIAETVVKWVNAIGGDMLSRWPGLEIQFGLHATSVRNRLPVLAGVDERIRIVWEDCGAFPYAYLSRDVEGEGEMLALTDAIMALRPGCAEGVVLKGQVCLDWSAFEHQGGSFILGCADAAAIARRMETVRPMWHDVQSYWLAHVGQARRTLDHLQGAGVYALVEDGLLEEACWLPVALYAQLLWTPESDDTALLQSVALRSDVVMA